MAGDNVQRQAMLERARARELAGRPNALVTYRELMDRQRQGKAQQGDTTRLRAAREILKRSGGIPRDEATADHRTLDVAEGEAGG